MPDVLSAACFGSLRPQYKNQQAEGELPAAIEHLFSQGTMIDHYFITLSPDLVQELTPLLATRQSPAGSPVSGVVFCQQPDGAPWQVHFRERMMIQDVCIEMPDAEFRALLAANQVTLPGEG